MLDPQLQAFLLTHYPIQSVRSASPLATKGQRQALRLETDRGDFVLKISDPGRAEAVVASDTGILAFLEAQDFPAPRLLRTRDGQAYLRCGDGYLHLYAYLPGEHPRPRTAFMQQAGRMLARLHSLPGEDYGLESGYTPAAMITEVRGYLERALATSQRELALGLLRRLEALPCFDFLPRGLIHTDPYLVNWVEAADGSLTLIDWDDAGLGIPLLDVGYWLAHLTTYPRHEARRWGVEETGEITYRPDWGRDFLTAYEEIRPLSPLEHELLRGAAQLSGLVYVWDWETERLIEDSVVRLEMVEKIC